MIKKTYQWVCNGKTDIFYTNDAGDYVFLEARLPFDNEEEAVAALYNFLHSSEWHRYESESFELKCVYKKADK